MMANAFDAFIEVWSLSLCKINDTGGNVSESDWIFIIEN